MKKNSCFILSRHASGQVGSFFQSGFSLVEVMVGLGIASILLMAILSSIATQNKEFKASDEKISLQNTQMLITNVLSDSSFCFCFLGGQTFNYTSQVWNGFPTSVSSSYTPTCVPQGAALLTVGTKMGGSSLLPTSLQMKNVTETVAGSGNFTANLIVQFDQTQLTRSRKNLSIPMTFKIKMSDPVGTRSLDSCSAVGGGGGGAGGLDMATICAKLGGIYNSSAIPPCQVTYQ